MTEIEHIAQLFEKLYDGDAWIAESLAGTLQNIPAEKAAKKIDPWNSIWEIVNHMVSWRENVLRRVQGDVIVSPADNYFSRIEDQSQSAWEATLEALKLSEKKWVAFLKIMNEGDLEKIYPRTGATYYHNILGIIQHDAYHLGQIILLAKK